MAEDWEAADERTSGVAAGGGHVSYVDARTLDEFRENASFIQGRLLSVVRPLDASEIELVERATEIVDRCGDGRLHTVAAAARAADGRMVTGLNVYHFTGGPCAELVLLGNAAELGVERLDVIVAVADRTRGILPPCGRCRQVLLDYHPGIRVLIAVDGVVESRPIVELLPFGFRWTVESGSVPSGDRRKFS